MGILRLTQRGRLEERSGPSQPPQRGGTVVARLFAVHPPATRRAVLMAAAGLFAAGSLPRIGKAASLNDPLQPPHRIATGPSETTAFAVGRIIAGIISQPEGTQGCVAGNPCGVPGLIAVAQQSESPQLAVAALGARRVDSAIARADAAAALLPEGRSVQALASLYVASAQVLVRADSPIETMGQLRGKRVWLGKAGSNAYGDSLAILQAHGLGPRSVTLVASPQAAGFASLATGSIDALIQFDAEPIASLVPGTQLRQLSLNPNAAARLAAVTGLAAATVPSVGKGDASILTIVARVLWIVPAETNAAVAGALVDALWRPENRQRLQRGHPALRDANPQSAVVGLTVPFHPGAAAAYARLGVLGR